MEILFLNHHIKNCGVYQYGLRLFEILNTTNIKTGKNITYHYVELENFQQYQKSLTDYPDIIAVIYNYHATTMTWLNPNNIQNQVKNIGILHECPNTMFDIVGNIDPNGVGSSNTFNIPRPIYENIDQMLSDYILSTETIKNFIEYKDSDTPIFGSFGFGFANKGFERIISLINEHYDKAIIKIVIPLAHFDPDGNNTVIHAAEKCRALNTNPNIQLMMIHEFFTTKDLLYFLRSNTMNVFLYDYMHGRGISSVIDYALSVKIPLAISDSYMFRNIYSDKINAYKNIKNITFDHCHPYLSLYRHENVINTFSAMVMGLEVNYSQIYQDKFALTMNKYCENGYYLEIGSNHPIIHNNTYLMANKYKWKGLMVEYDGSFEQLYKDIRPSSYYKMGDARTVDYRKILDDYDFPTNINYLQIDLDVDNRSTLDVLELLDNTVFDKYKFGAITFEHDIYTGNYFDTREKSRAIFSKRGYHLLFSDVSVFFNGQICPFEDWYIHPDIIKNYDITYDQCKIEDIKQICAKII